MKRERLSIKQKIAKRIELRHQNLVFIDKRGLKTTQESNRHSTVHKPSASAIDVERTKLNVVSYVKKMVVDYDVVICIPSHERYEKVKRLISQFYTQSTKYKFKIILLNDGSSDSLYDTLTQDFPEIIYIKNDKPNGKLLHWYCYTQMWKQIKDIQCHVILQMDDDFILSDYFLNFILDLFFQEKEKNNKMLAIAPHLWSTKEESDFEPWWVKNDCAIDGIGLIDEYLIKCMDYEMKSVDVNKIKEGSSVFAWSQISAAIKKLNGFVYKTPYSYVYHDGNDDSKLHNTHRKKEDGKVYTQKYIGKL